MKKNETNIEKDFVASKIVRDLPDAYDEIIDIDIIQSIGEAVFLSAPNVFDRKLSGITVTGINDKQVDFVFGNWNFTIEQDGIIREQLETCEIAKAELEPIFVDALNKGFYQVEVSMKAERRLNCNDLMDEIINEAKKDIEEIVEKEGELRLPDDILL